MPGLPEQHWCHSSQPSKPATAKCQQYRNNTGAIAHSLPIPAIAIYQHYRNNTGAIAHSLPIPTTAIYQHYRNSTGAIAHSLRNPPLPATLGSTVDVGVPIVASTPGFKPGAAAAKPMPFPIGGPTPPPPPLDRPIGKALPLKPAAPRPAPGPIGPSSDVSARGGTCV